MSANTAATTEIEAFLEAWGQEKQPMCNRFRMLYQELVSMDGVTINFVARPGVSYSMRPKHRNQKERELFAIVDVIDDDPQDRWLSVCFYGDMISDPEERGELIPGGLAGSDGYCFDMYEDDETLTLYLIDRIREAGTAAQN